MDSPHLLKEEDLSLEDAPSDLLGGGGAGVEEVQAQGGEGKAGLARSGLLKEEWWRGLVEQLRGYRLLDPGQPPPSPSSSPAHIIIVS